MVVRKTNLYKFSRMNNKKDIFHFIVQVFPGINKKVVENDINSELGLYPHDIDMVQNHLIEKYISMNGKYPKEVKRNSHYSCSVCKQFVTIFLRIVVVRSIPDNVMRIHCNICRPNFDICRTCLLTRYFIVLLMLKTLFLRNVQIHNHRDSHDISLVEPSHPENGMILKFIIYCMIFFKLLHHH
jgi:hypothetical protein